MRARVGSRRLGGVGWLLPLLALVACGTEITTTQTGPEEVIETATFAPTLGIDLSQMIRLPSGIYIQDITVGSGEGLALGDYAEVRFVGYLRNGAQFTQGETTFLMGNSEVIAGFEQGVMGMKAGGFRRIIIPSVLAFGNAQNGVVPPGAIVIYEVDLVSVQRIGS